MLDSLLRPLIDPPLRRLAQPLARSGVTANQITVAGFFVGMLAVPLLWSQLYALALLAIAANRLLDGLDGTLARLRNQVSDRGGYLDIVLDFIFYSAVPFGFALSDPSRNALPAAFLIWSFIATGASFLAAAIMAERQNPAAQPRGQKSFFYSYGLMEGSETILALLLFCLFANQFWWLAWLVALWAWVTAAARIVATLRSLQG